MAAQQPHAQRRTAPPIKILAAARGVTQARFSQDTGLPYHTVHRVWNSELAPGPRFRSLAEQYFEVPAEQLFHPERSTLPGKTTMAPRRRGGAR